MRMPKLHLDPSQFPEGIARFRTECGAVHGTAYLARGENETHYEVVEVERVPGVVVPRVSQVADEVGCFEVVGSVVNRFEDGVSVVDACGFTFWVDPVEADDELQIGAGLRLLVKNLTLYAAN